MNVHLTTLYVTTLHITIVEFTLEKIKSPISLLKNGEIFTRKKETLITKPNDPYPNSMI
jgi:hypothetical protein